MVDENRVRLMTKLAIYEKHESNKSLVMSKYYKSDYVRYNVLKTLVAATIVYWCAIGAYVFMEFDTMLAKINEIDYFDIMYKLLAGYVAFGVLYFLFATLLYSYRYAKAKPGLVEYNVNLKALIKAEDGENATGKVVDNSEVKLAMDSSAANAEDTYKQRNQNKVKVSRSDMVKQHMQQQEKIKEQQIIENVKQRNERIAAQNEAKLRQQRQMDDEKRKIQERRKQLERQQMDKLRNERMQRMSQTREEHEYQGDSNSKDMRRRDR